MPLCGAFHSRCCTASYPLILIIIIMITTTVIIIIVVVAVVVIIIIRSSSAGSWDLVPVFSDLVDAN